MTCTLATLAVLASIVAGTTVAQAYTFTRDPAYQSQIRNGSQITPHGIFDGQRPPPQALRVAAEGETIKSKLLLTATAVALVRIPPSMTPETECGPAKHALVRFDQRDVCGRHLG